MQEIIKDVQKSSYKSLMNDRLPAIIEGASTEIGNGFYLKFKPMDISNSILIKGEDGTEYHCIKAICSLHNDRNNSDTVEFIADLLHVPALQELGFKIKGNYMQRLDEYERARGWTFWHSAKVDSAKLLAENGRSIAFEYDQKKIPIVSFSIRGPSKKKVSVSTFLRAVTGYSSEELISTFGFNNPYIIEIFSQNSKLMPEVGWSGKTMANRNDCIFAVAESMFGDTKTNPRTVSVMLKDIKDNLFSQRYFPMGKGNVSRLNYLQSYSYRANGRTLAESIECNGYKFEEGIVLTTKELSIIDALPVTELKVEWNGKLYILHKFSTFTFRALGCRIGEDISDLGISKGSVLTEDQIRALNESPRSTLLLENGNKLVRKVGGAPLTIEDLFTAFSIWADNLNGYDMYAKQYEVTNRILVPFDKAIENMIQKNLGIIISNVSNNVNVTDLGDSITMALNDCCKGIQLDEFIASITSDTKNSGQMSDMCNLLAFASKSSKATSQVPANAVTPEMVNVQDLQEGRFDPLDVPESNKIGRVHYRTMLSKLDDGGSPMTPFLKVVNGEIVSEEPVYLTAVEEADHYIAEWNETFVNENGEKKDRIRTRCNGNVQTVELSRVEFKEYSPYQNLSPAHSMIPFPGHSNGKRITMACNQEKQAVPCVKRERPYVGAGGESILDIGCYTAESILQSFYEDRKFAAGVDKEAILNSRLQLTSTDTGVGEKTLYFKILDIPEPNTTTLTVPYLFRNFEATMFSYDINPVKDNIYSGDDVVCYNNSYSLDKKELVMCADFGAQKIDQKVFEKGISLVKNLNVAYKTCEGSTIEDGILISDRLVFDDELTHIGLFEVSDVLSSNEDISENFGITEVGVVDYFHTNGLPKIGTELKGGMPVISKIVYKNGKGSAKYVKVPTYVSGQVVSAEIHDTYKGVEATVIIAQRSYVQSGDKLAGRCGNKGVTAKILPYSQMPYVKDSGEIVDVVLNPLGIPSRQNITQLLEAALQMCMKMDDTYAIVTPYKSNDTDFVREQAEAHGVVPKIMIDGRTGQEFVRPINVGNLPLYKLHHVSKRKIHAVGMDAKLDSTFLQPMKGSKQNGGQSFGEMETWCLEATGATTLLQDLFSFQSDDVIARKEAISGLREGNVRTVDGENNNDLAMQACYRSMGVEFSVNDEEKCYEFKPLTDEIIKSFSPQPVTNESMLHSPAIFGKDQKLDDRMMSRKNWGWMELHTKMIMPLWISKGSIPTMLGISNKVMQDIIGGSKYIHKKSLNIIDEEEIRLEPKQWTEEKLQELISGMPGLVHLFEHFDTELAEINAKYAVEEYYGNHTAEYISKSNTYSKLIKRYRLLHEFNQSDVTLSDYVVTTFPIMPAAYRPLIHSSGRRMVPDFDWYYLQILSAAKNVEDNENDISIKELYEKIASFTGIGPIQNEKYQNLLSFFSGKGRKSHGKIRENVQSKRVMCSGRAAIKPAEDIRRTPLELGVPFTMAVKMWFEPIYGIYSSMSNALGNKLPSQLFSQMIMLVAQRDRREFVKLFNSKCTRYFSYNSANDAYDAITKDVKEFMKDQVVLAGRQPSLHKYSIRAFTPYIVYDYMIHIHPLVCTAYNADFDGDQMYITASQTQAAKENALETLSPNKDFILPKDSTVVLEHTQDIVLGTYCATMLQDNASHVDYKPSDVHYYDSVDTIRMDIFNGQLRCWDLVSLRQGKRRYLSTAGRLMFNAMVPGAFTDEPYTNTLELSFIKPELYHELKYDGIIGAGKINKNGLRYYELKTICKDIFDSVGSDCISSYQAISEFGFTMSDLFGVSLSLFDFDIVNSKKEMLNDTASIKAAIEKDYQDGLISEKDKRNAVIAIYADGKSGVNGRIMNDLIEHLPRNNNIFIMMDSGARGNKSQFMHMCGAIGILQKSKTEDLEAAVTSNYYDGLGSFDVHLASYSARTGVASTQNETKNAGYATRQVVYMASGIEIVEDDCGNKDWTFEIDWDERNSDKELFEPSHEWFKKHLLGERVAELAPEAVKAFTTDGVFTEQSYSKIVVAGGFHSITLQSGKTYTADIYHAKGKKVTDKVCEKLLKRVSNGLLTMSGIDALLRQKVKEVATENGIYRIHYDMDSCCKNMLKHRVAADNLPYLKTVRDVNTGKNVRVVTDDTIKWIEDTGVDKVDVRTVLGCHSKHGICAHCYGLKFSDLQIPKVGSFVGTESAQSIGEPAAQLTMNVINKGGVSGASNISSGVDVFESLIRGSLPASEGAGAIIANKSGYLHIDKMDDSSVVSIRCESVDSDLCRACKYESGVLKCPLDTNRGEVIKCQFKEKIMSQSIIQKNGEWVNAGEPITYGMIHPDSITILEGDNSPERIHTKKQRIWVKNYYDTFKNSGVTVNARHFELIAHVQNQYVVINYDSAGELEIGKVYEFNEIRDKLDSAEFKQFVCKKEEAILWNSGAFTALSFEDVASVAANLVTTTYKASTEHNRSLIGSLSIGEHMAKREPKKFNKPKVLKTPKRKTVQKQNEPAVKFVTEEQPAASSIQSFNLDGLDMEALFDTAKTETVAQAIDSFTSVPSEKESYSVEDFISDTYTEEEPDGDTIVDLQEHVVEPTSNYNNVSEEVKASRITSF